MIALTLGYEDNNDNDELRRDLLIALLLGCSDLTGVRRDRSCTLAGPNMLNRLSWTAIGQPQIATSTLLQIQKHWILLVDIFMESHAKPPEALWLNLDATDNPPHGNQKARFFHGFYRHYCLSAVVCFLTWSNRLGQPSKE